MTKRPYINVQYLPPKFSLSQMIIVWLLCDRYSFPQWATGSLLTVMALFWIAGIYTFVTGKAERPSFESGPTKNG